MRITSLPFIGLALMIFWTTTQADAAPALSCEDYLQQVRTDNANVQAAQIARQAAQGALVERQLITSPYFFAEGQMARDKSQSWEPLLYGDERSQDQFSVGLEAQTLFGLRWRLLHKEIYTSLKGTSPLLMPMPDYYTAKSGLELSQDLWRNALGREWSSQGDALESKNRSLVYEREYQIRQLLVQAEIFYWRLVAAREVVRIQQELLSRAEKLANWVADRVAFKLQDQSDLMQAQSEVKVRQLELSASQDQERMAARAFNLMRAQNVETVPESLAFLNESILTLPAFPETMPLRRDLQALEQQTQAARYQAQSRREGLQPEFQLQAAAYLNGLDPDWPPAVSDSWRTDFLTYAVGVSLRLPLDWWVRWPLQTAYDQEAEAAEHFLVERRLEVETEWHELGRRFQETKARLEITRSLEELQKRKAEYERVRLSRGNSVTFQVLQFEQDWGKSQLARVQSELAMIELLAQRKLFEE